MKRLLYFTQNYSPHDFRFLSKLVSTEHDVYYMRLEFEGTETRYIPAGVRQVEWEYGTRPFDISNLQNTCNAFITEVNRICPDVIHAGPLNICAYIAVMQHTVPVVAVSWGYDVSHTADALNAKDQRTGVAIRYAKHIIYDSEFTKFCGNNFWQAPSSAVSVIPWGTDLKLFSFSPKKRGPYYVIFHNRPHQDRYHFQTVINGFILARKELSNLRMIVMGSPTYSTAQAKAKLLDSGYNKSVRFIRPVSENNLAAFYHLSDLYLSACPVDGTSISLLNAMACGNQILVANIPSNAEWVQDDERFNMGDSYGLADGIVLSYKMTPEARRVLRQANFQKVTNNGSWDANFEKFMKVYRSL